MAPTGPLPPDPAAFGLGSDTGPVTVLQTHIGWVYLAGSFAFKIKKPVRFEFLDFSTLDGRRWALEREMTLNRRLCPDLYLSLDPIVCTSSGPRVGNLTDGPVVDWALRMRRLPAERMLDALLDRGAVTVDDAARIAGVLCPFYLSQRGHIPPGGLGDLECVRGNVEENLREGDALTPDVLPRGALSLIARRARHYLDRHGTRIRERAVRGFVVDGHGDLRVENVWLPETGAPLLFDCIEFNDRFRICDSAQDVAFLAMDFQSRGREDLAASFLDCYRRGCDSDLDDRLLRFHLGYRAFVKGKVAAWIAADPDVSPAQRETSVAQARTLFELAVRYALESEPLLVVFCGVSGSGKSTLASALARRLGWDHHASDAIRDQVVPRGEPAARRYSREAAAEVYRRLLNLARVSLDAGRGTILDAVFSSVAGRRAAVDLARLRGVPVVLVHVHCAPEVVERHLAERRLTGALFGSEADAQVSAGQRGSFQLPEESEGFNALVRVETSREGVDTFQELWDRLLAAVAKV